jgi:hypothetical protein
MVFFSNHIVRLINVVLSGFALHDVSKGNKEN